MFSNLARNVFSMFMANNDSLVAELFEYFKNKYFTLEIGEYTNISVDAASIGTVIISFFIGLNIAALLSLFNKRVLGDFVRALIANGCLSTEKAKTLSELGFMKNTAVRGSLRSGVTLRRVVRCVEEEEYLAAIEEKETFYEQGDETGKTTGNSEESQKQVKSPAFRSANFKIDFEKAHFYIPEKFKYTAEIKFEKKGTNPMTFLLVLVLSFTVMILLFRYLPDVFYLFDNFIESFKS